jgi:hypothetical protein
VPSNWCNITDLATKKDISNFWAAKMGTVQLMTPEFNTNSKHIGKDSELCQVIPKGHGRSWKGKQAIEQALNKLMALDLTRQPM